MVSHPTATERYAQAQNTDYTLNLSHCITPRHSTLQSSIHSFTLIHPFIDSFIDSFIHSFIHSPPLALSSSSPQSFPGQKEDQTLNPKAHTNIVLYFCSSLLSRLLPLFVPSEPTVSTYKTDIRAQNPWEDDCGK